MIRMNYDFYDTIVPLNYIKLNALSQLDSEYPLDVAYPPTSKLDLSCTWTVRSRRENK